MTGKNPHNCAPPIIWISSLFLVRQTLCTLLSLAMFTLCISGCKPSRKQVGPREKITIAYSTIPHTVLFHIAFVKGFFSSEGLDVTLQPYPFGKVALNAVLEGKADMATPADTPVMFAIIGGKDVQIIAEIATSSKSLAIVARKDKGITSPQKLKGKIIGVSLGTTGDYFMDSFFVTRGIKRSEVKLVDLKPGEMLDALNKGRVDAVSTWVTTLQQVQKGLSENGITFYDEAIFQELICLVVSQNYVKNHPEAIKKVLRAIIKAETFVKENPEEARGLVAEFIKIDRALLDEIWGIFTFKVTLDQALIANLENQARWALKNKLTTGTKMPNFLEHIYSDGLGTVKPNAVRIIH